MTSSELEFWFDFASPYAYVSAGRLEDWMSSAGINVRWTPFLLGPVFQKQGWSTSPFNLYPLKGKYMWRDVERLCKRHNLGFSPPEEFPQHGLLATRVAMVGRDEDWLPAFCRRVFHKEFGLGQDISDRQTVLNVLEGLVDNPAYWVKRAVTARNKKALLERGVEAEQKGIFGAPTFVTPDGELFWGDDRLEQAIEWILRRR
ncbi:MAG: 2-hydroxychromene-2-carboxylate isomerase [Pseudomonadota bacterium]